MKFNIDDFKGNYAMHCKTEKESEEFRKILHEAGKRFRSGESYLERKYWGAHKENTCYGLDDGMYGPKSEYLRDGYKILEWSDFNMDFTKADLKVGMMVETRNGRKFIVMEDYEGKTILTKSMLWGALNDYTFYLMRNDGNEDWDVTKVWSKTRHNGELLKLEEDGRDLLFERETKPKEITLQEIADKFGMDVSQIRIKD